MLEAIKQKLIDIAILCAGFVVLFLIILGVLLSSGEAGDSIADVFALIWRSV